MKVLKRDLIILQRFSREQYRFIRLIDNTNEGIIASRVGDSIKHP